MSLNLSNTEARIFQIDLEGERVWVQSKIDGSDAKILIATDDLEGGPAKQGYLDLSPAEYFRDIVGLKGASAPGTDKAKEKVVEAIQAELRDKRLVDNAPVFSASSDVKSLLQATTRGIFSVDDEVKKNSTKILYAEGDSEDLAGLDKKVQVVNKDGILIFPKVDNKLFKLHDASLVSFSGSEQEKVSRQDKTVSFNRGAEDPIKLGGKEYEVSINFEPAQNEKGKNIKNTREFAITLTSKKTGAVTDVIGFAKIDPNTGIPSFDPSDGGDVMVSFDGGVTKKKTSEIFNAAIAGHEADIGNRMIPGNAAKFGKTVDNINKVTGPLGNNVVLFSKERNDSDENFVFYKNDNDEIMVGTVEVDDEKVGAPRIQGMRFTEAPVTLTEYLESKKKEGKNEKDVLDELELASEELHHVLENGVVLPAKAKDISGKDIQASANLHKGKLTAGELGDDVSISHSRASNGNNKRTEMPSGGNTYVTNNYAAPAPTPPGGRNAEANQRLVDAAEERKNGAGRKGLPPALVTTGFGAAVGAIFSAFNKEVNPLLATGIGAVCGYFASRFPAVDRLVGDLVHGAQQAPAMATQQAR